MFFFHFSLIGLEGLEKAWEDKKTCTLSAMKLSRKPISYKRSTRVLFLLIPFAVSRISAK